MFRAIFLSSVLISSVAIGNDVQEAEACGVKMGARKAPKIQRSQSSKNPSRILVVGAKDSDLLKQLRGARHTTEYASNVSNAKRDRYDLVIADESQLSEARSRFSNTQILKKKSSTRSTTSVAETLLARSASKTSTKSGLVAVKEQRKPVATGTEGASTRSATASGTEAPVATSTPATRVSSGTEDPKPTRVAVADTQPKPDPVVKPEPKPAEPKVEKPKPERKPRPVVDDTSDDEPVKATNLKWTRAVTFGTNKTSLGPAQMRRLKQNAQWMQENPDATITIEGHTDSVGDEAYNMDLSERRANMARDFLVSFGISADRITVEAKGEEEPAVQPSTSGRNRRIVMIKN